MMESVTYLVVSSSNLASKRSLHVAAGRISTISPVCRHNNQQQQQHTVRMS